MAQKTQVNSATLIIGPTGTGKSALARTLAAYLWERWKKVLYYYTCDGGGYPAPVQEGIELGQIKVFRMRTRDPGDLGLAFETCYRAAQGWWPRRINPRTGEVEPGVEMVPPVQKRWEMYCASGHLVKSVVGQSLLTAQACPQCKALVTAQTMQVREVLVHSRGFEDRGGVFFDGLSSMLSWEMMELGQRAGKMELRGEEAAIGGKVISGSLKFGGTTRSHVGFAQTRGEELAHLALGIPHLLVPPVFTALSMEASDEGNLSIVGPKIAGRAKTDEAPQWFGNCLEAAKRPNPAGMGEQFVLYLSEFTDQEGRRHLLKHRGSPGTMPDELADPPFDKARPTTAFSQFNLGVFFSLLDEALTRGVEAAKLQYPDAPGVPDGIVEYGESTATIQGQPTGPAEVATGGTVGAAPSQPSTPAAPSAPRRAATPRARSTTPATPAAAAPAPTGVTPGPAAAAPAVPGGTPQAPPPAARPPVPSARPAGAAPPPGARPAPLSSGPLARPPAAAPRVPSATSTTTAPAARPVAAPASTPQP